eukprot:c12059_g1_i1.p2 GENE.c12059_g1_i1~~c12059_g1_i1.p2  ORF type:complete len:313 (+),score=63.23 c12059_g1_i1:1572-2510(+)
MQLELGSGATSKVYCGVWHATPTTSRRVAIKVLSLDFPDPCHVVSSLNNEVVMAARLSRDIPLAVVPLYCVCIAPPEVMMVFELARTSLEKHLRSNSPPSRLDRLDIGVQVARCVRALHGTLVVHRDIKPHNVLQTYNGDWLIADLGSSFQASTSTDTAGGASGTPEYASPELLRDHVCGFPTDIWSLGILLWELWDCNNPCEPQDNLDTSSRNSSAQLQQPQHQHKQQQLERYANSYVAIQANCRPRDAPPGFSELVVDCMCALDPTARPSAQHVVEALTNIRDAYRSVRRVSLLSIPMPIPMPATAPPVL